MVTKKLSQEFTRTESRILGALSYLDDFLLNPLSQATPEPLRRRSGTYRTQNMERMRTTPRVILVLKKASLRARLHKTVAQKMAMTSEHEFRKKLNTAPLEPLRANRRKLDLQINCICAVETSPRRLKQAKFCWPFSS